MPYGNRNDESVIRWVVLLPDADGMIPDLGEYGCAVVGRWSKWIEHPS